MDNSIIKVADTFWNIRGSFKLGGRIDIGTQASLVQLASGNFVFLDAYAFDADQQETINSIIGGSRVEAILNLHPFHTVNVERMHGNAAGGGRCAIPSNTTQTGANGQ